VSSDTGPARYEVLEVRTTPIVPWPYMPRYAALSKKTTPVSEPSETGAVREPDHRFVAARLQRTARRRGS
jgi:hypothetical protein